MDGFYLSVTPLYAGIFALIYIALAARVILQRYSVRVGLGTGDDPTLLHRVRAHGNFAEYVPFCLLLLAMAEINGLSATLLHAAGLLLLIGRLAHVWGLSRTDGASVPRAFGMIVTFGVLLSVGLYLIAGSLLVT
tara:strand:- start:933 stop:1337 length:405 start_codon:yes stop_codon:yes gene_type:complete